MSLQVWLPLRGDIKNYGLSNITLTSNGTPSVDNNGKIGKCYSFNGSSYFQSNETFLNNMTACSLSCWVKDTYTGTSWMRIFGIGEHTRVHLDTNGSGQVRFFVSKDGTTGTYWGPISKTNIKDSTWHHVCGTFDNHFCKIYIDGKCETSVATNALSTVTGGKLYLGHVRDGIKLNGALNDVRIYDHCLSVKEVEEISKGLVLHYKLDNNGMGGNNLAIDTANKIVTATATGTDVNSTTALDYGFQSNWANLRGKTITISCDIELINAVNTTGVTNYRVGIEPAIKYTDNTTGYYGIWVALNSTPQTSSKRYSKTVTLPDKDFASMVQNGMYIQHLTNGTATIKNVKVELGSTATPWSPNPTDLGIDSSIVYDSSGYGNDGDLTNNEITSDTARYTSALALNGTTVDNSSNTKAGAAYLRGFLSLPASDALTVTWWGKIAAYGRGGIFQTTSVSNPSECTDYNTTTIANWDSTFRIYNGSNSFNIFSWFKKDNAWHHHAIVFNGSSIIYYCDGEALVTTAFTGPLVAFNGFCMGLGKAGGVYRQIKQTISDLRIYVTGLSSEAVLELYHTSATIDNTGNIHARELVE